MTSEAKRGPKNRLLGGRHMEFIKHYWYGMIGVGALVVFLALLVTGVLQP